MYSIKIHSDFSMMAFIYEDAGGFQILSASCPGYLTNLIFHMHEPSHPVCK